MQVSVVSYKQAVENDRFGAEYWRSDLLEILKKPKNWKPIGRLLNRCQYGISREMNEDGIGKPIYRMNEIFDGLMTEPAKCVELSNEEYKEFKLYKDDVLFNRTNSYKFVGRTGILKENIDAVFASYLIRLNPNIDELLPEYLTIYLNCPIGIGQVKRRAMESINQTNVSGSEIKKVPIPLLDYNFQKEIARLVNKAANQIAKSKQIYSKAEQLFLDELELADWQAEHKLSFVKYISETEKVKRIDAEYFQPKYEQIIKAVKKFKGGWDILDNLVEITKSIEPGSSEYKVEGIKFLRVSNLSKFGLDNSSPVYLSEKFYKENKKHQPKQGEILLSKDATPGIAYYLNEKPEEMIVSGGILRLKLKDEHINEDYLALALNSVIVQEQAERDAGGSVIKHWRPDQIKNVIIPLLDKPIQTKIQQKIRQSFEARHKSKQLLEIAKRAVEMAIERDEKTAMEWIEEQGNFEE